ncbi:MAG: hypothetical protein JO165_09190 [Candidatus Eremiobacteraeota bacterium]|nr:hypothetical protein [Candidatus Eremiobacteraeota bacterium]
MARSSDNPPLSASLTADARFDRLDIIPQVFYQTGTYYNIGYTTDANGIPSMIPMEHGSAWYLANLSFIYKVNEKKGLYAAFRIRNLTDNGYGTTPCFANNASGCFPFAATLGTNGGNSNFNTVPNNFVNQYVTTDPRRFEFSLTQKL